MNVPCEIHVTINVTAPLVEKNVLLIVSECPELHPAEVT